MCFNIASHFLIKWIYELIFEAVQNYSQLLEIVYNFWNVS